MHTKNKEICVLFRKGKKMFYRNLDSKSVTYMYGGPSLPSQNS